MEKIKYDNKNVCPSCGCRHQILVKDTIGTDITEAETTCKKCGHKDYWAYGWYESKIN